MNINEFAIKLRLPYTRDNWQQLYDEVRHTKQDYATFLKTFSMVNGNYECKMVKREELKRQSSL